MDQALRSAFSAKWLVARTPFQGDPLVLRIEVLASILYQPHPIPCFHYSGGRVIGIMPARGDYCYSALWRSVLTDVPGSFN
jgi:hypothetical protein